MELKLSIAICESHHAAVVFKTKVLHLRVKNTRQKTNGKEKFKKMLSFLLWTRKASGFTFRYSF